MMQQSTQLNKPLFETLLFVTCPSGFEHALQEELNEIFHAFQLQAQVYTGSAGCYVNGPFDCCILANLYSFCASRVLIVLLECVVHTENDLHKKVMDLNWHEQFDVHKNFLVKSNVSNSFLQNSMYLSLKVKDAICDSFMKSNNQRPNVELKDPDIKVYVRLVSDQLSVSIDTSGNPLFMRGYKKNSHQAPMKETLAASLLRISGWNKISNSIFTSDEPVYFERVDSKENDADSKRKIPKQILCSPFLQDQFCGSGTIPIEAALALFHYNPNCMREHFSFMNLMPSNRNEIQIKYEEIKAKLISRKKTTTEILSAITSYAKRNDINFNHNFPIHASDISESSIQFAKETAIECQVNELIQFQCLDASQTTPHASHGFIVINPPYGERLSNQGNLTNLYKEIGNNWKKNFSHWSGWLLSSNEDLTKSVGLRATRKFSVYNGNLECRFLQYVMYPFSKN